MKHVIWTESRERRLPFFLAMEEWIAANMPPGEWFFTWRVKPTVIFGRNQEPDKEVDLEYCREKGIEVYRRKSGGGCVYADMDNVMMSFVSSIGSGADVASRFSHYTELLAAMLRGLGLDARATGRNDVTIADRKVSGNAFYHLPGGKCISHGTMLFSTDMSNILRAITPSRAKLESNKVKSVASRITTISEHLPDMKIEDFVKYAEESLTDGAVTLSPSQISEVEEIERGYYEPAWLWSGGTRGPLHARGRLEGVGEVAVYTSLDHGHVASLEIHGDFFAKDDPDLICRALTGRRFDCEDFESALKGLPLGSIIEGLTDEALLALVFGDKTTADTLT